MRGASRPWAGAPGDNWLWLQLCFNRHRRGAVLGEKPVLPAELEPIVILNLAGVTCVVSPVTVRCSVGEPTTSVKRLCPLI